jgi:peptidoglycan/LPS O-acetylase OafA/YrhL
MFSHQWILAYSDFDLTKNNVLYWMALGNPAVMGFFFLSGFAIAEAINTFYKNRPNAFLANRFLRIFPPFLLAVVVSCSFHYYIIVKKGVLGIPEVGYQFSSEMFSYKNILDNITAIIPIFNFRHIYSGDFVKYSFVGFDWAISVMMIFYVSVFFIFSGLTSYEKICSNCPAKIQMPKTNYLLAITIFSLLILHIVNDYHRRIHYAFQFIPYFMAGMIYYSEIIQPKNIKKVTLLVCFIFMILHFPRYIAGFQHSVIGNSEATVSWYLSNIKNMHIILPTILMLIIIILASLLAKVKRPSEFIVKLDKYFSELSYYLYINHYVILILFFSIWLQPNRNILTFVFAMLASIILSIISELVVEPLSKKVRVRLRGAEV